MDTTIKPIIVQIPWWAEDEENQDMVLLFAFLYKLGIAYGFRNLFTVYDSDIRMILGQTGIAPKLFLDDKGYKRWLQVGQAYDDRSSFKLKMVDPDRIDSRRAIEKELTDTRCQLLYIYLQGAFCNNLVEQKDHKKRIGLDRVLKKNLLHGLL